MPKTLKHEIITELMNARAVLNDLEQLGVTGVYHSSQSEVLPEKIHEPSEHVSTLSELGASITGCTLCQLSKDRTQVVFGVGNPDAELVFVGEAPGRDEDLQGEPFVGEAGKLLDRILLAMGLQRSKVYICNVIKCRPPKNRDPLADEIATCEPFLKQQLSLIKPRLIVSLGKFATQTLLQNEAPISRLRGKWHEYQGIPLMPTYHPAYLLRSPSGKRDVWEDMKQVLHRLHMGD